jgi:hypothetical protein
MSDPTLYRQARRYVLTLGRPVKPADLQRTYSMTWNASCSLLEELERDLVLRRTGGFGRLEWAP